MNDLIEIVEDLETITVNGTSNTAFEEIVDKWVTRRQMLKLRWRGNTN